MNTGRLKIFIVFFTALVFGCSKSNVAPSPPSSCQMASITIGGTNGTNYIFTYGSDNKILSINDYFMNTRNAVEKRSNGQQRPWEEARLKGVFYLK